MDELAVAFDRVFLAWPALVLLFKPIGGCRIKITPEKHAYINMKHYFGGVFRVIIPMAFISTEIARKTHDLSAKKSD